MRTMLFTALLAIGTIGACDRKTNTERVESRKPVEDQTATPAMPPPSTTDVDTERSDLRRWVDERAERLNARIEELEKRGDEKSKQAAASLRVKRDQARAKADELGSRTKDNWQNFKKDVQDAWDQLERDVDEATR